MLCPACLVVPSVAAVNQLVNKVALVAGTRLVNFQASAATYLSCDIDKNYIVSKQSISLDIYGADQMNK